MKAQRLRILLGAGCLLAVVARAADPVVEYVNAVQRAGTKLVDIEFRISDADGDRMTITLIGEDRETGNQVQLQSVTGPGADGSALDSGTYTVVWDAGADWGEKFTRRFVVSIDVTEAGGAQPTGRYLLIDLSGGPAASEYPVSSLEAVPDGGWTDVHKTTTLVLRRIPAGIFTMGSPPDEVGRWDYETQHQVTLTQDFYIGVFEVTQKQWERVMGGWPSWFSNVSVRDSRPVEQVAYDDIRGTSAGSGWPGDNDVDSDSFMGKLRRKTGLVLDVPTEAQWEYACRAGTTTALNSGKNLTDEVTCPNMAELGRYWYNGGEGYSSDCGLVNGTAEVGSYLPNAWGLYAMHGNVWEWCLDWYESDLGTQAVTDPVGDSTGSYRVYRGGCWSDFAARFCRSAGRHRYWPDHRGSNGGLRVCSAPPGR